MNRKLGRKKAHREHTIRNLATSLVLYETVDTTEPKAKEVKSFLEGIIAKSKKMDLNARKMLIGTLFDRNAVKKMIDELVPRYESRASGFIRNYHLKERAGDNAKMMRLELVDKKTFTDEKKAPKKQDIERVEDGNK